MNAETMLLTSENCPSSIVLDTSSHDVGMAIDKAFPLLKSGRVLAYVWRRNAHQLEVAKKLALSNVFNPLVKCVHNWSKNLYGFTDQNFVFKGSLLSDLNSKLPECDEIEFEYRVGSFGKVESKRGRNYLIRLQRSHIARCSIEEASIDPKIVKSYEIDFLSKNNAHIDGNMDFSISPFSVRVLCVQQGIGTRFWGVSPAEINQMGNIFINQNYVDESVLSVFPSYRTKEGDVLFFVSEPLSLQSAFIHGEGYARAMQPYKNPNLGNLRLLEICDLQMS